MVKQHSVPIKMSAEDVENKIMEKDNLSPEDKLSMNQVQGILTLYQNGAQSIRNHATKLLNESDQHTKGIEKLIPIHEAARSILNLRDLPLEKVSTKDINNFYNVLSIHQMARGRGEPFNLKPSDMALGFLAYIAKEGDRPAHPMKRRTFLLGAILATFFGCNPDQSDNNNNGTTKIPVKVNWYVQTAGGVQATSTVEATPGANNTLAIAGSPLANDVNSDYIAIREKGFINGGLIGKLMGNNAFGRTGSGTYALPNGVTEIDAMVLDAVVGNRNVEDTNEFYKKVVNGGLIGRNLIGKLKTTGDFVDCGGDVFSVPYASINEALQMYNNLGSVNIGGPSETADLHHGCKVGSSSKDWDKKEVWINSNTNNQLKSRYFLTELFEFLSRSPDLGTGGSIGVISDTQTEVLNQTGIDLVNASYFMKDMF